MKDILIICNGEKLNKTILQFLLKDRIILCCDGGVNQILPYHEPDYVIGDMDSIANNINLSSEKIIPIKEQDSSDLEKMLSWIIERQWERKKIIIVSMTGKRSDFSFYNLHLLRKYKDLNITVVDKKFIIQLVSQNVVLAHVPENAIISLLPLTEVENVTTTGLKFPLKNQNLIPGQVESISNASISEQIHIHLDQGLLLLFLEYKNLKSLKDITISTENK